MNIISGNAKRYYHRNFLVGIILLLIFCLVLILFNVHVFSGVSDSYKEDLTIFMDILGFGLCIVIIFDVLNDFQEWKKL